MINRRDVMLGGLAGAAALGLGRVNPDFLVNSAFAAEGKTLRFLGAEALTGNWAVVDAVMALSLFLRRLES